MLWIVDESYGVLRFASNYAIFDPLGIAVFVIFGHVILYFLFIFYITAVLVLQDANNLLQSAYNLLQHAGHGHDLINGHACILCVPGNSHVCDGASRDVKQKGKQNKAICEF